jgi:glycosyl transferase family 87
VPYRDFRLEYPPGALPVFALPALLSDRGDEPAYRQVFERMMALCGVAAVLLAAAVLAGLRARRRRVAAGLGAIALFPLLLGNVVLTRFDLWPAALILGALAALVWQRDRLGFGVLGLAVAAKLFPAVLVPVALSYVWRRRGRREAVVCLSILAGVVVLAFGPFLVLAPDGVAYSLGRQLGRPLQIESLGSGFLLAAHHLLGTELEMRSGHGSQNLAGTAPAVAAIVLAATQLAALIWIWLRRPGTPEELVRWSVAALVAFVALGKVLSPQFLIWLAPVVPLVAGRRGLRASVLLCAALVLTQLWFPDRYWQLALEFDGRASALVLARDLVLVALLAVLVSGARREPARSP